MAKLYHEEMSGKAKKVYAQRVPEVKNQFRRVFVPEMHGFSGFCMDFPWIFA